MRWLVGMGEACVLNGTIMYVSFWYVYDELALRSAIFFSVWSISGVFNGLLSYAIMRRMDGKNGWASWQWIFFIEGVSGLQLWCGWAAMLTLVRQIIPIAYALVFIALLPNLPERPGFWFSAREKEVLVRRARRAHNTENAKLRLPLVWETFKDPKILAMSKLFLRLVCILAPVRCAQKFKTWFELTAGDCRHCRRLQHLLAHLDGGLPPRHLGRKIPPPARAAGRSDLARVSGMRATSLS